MLTRRGWGVLAGAAVLLVCARLVGVIELAALGVALLAALVAALIWVRRDIPALTAGRELRPPRVHAGTASRVELSLRNPSRRGSPVVTVVDPFDHGRRWARFLLAPLAPGEGARAAYRLPTERRGVFALGPLQLERHDPLGLAVTSLEIAPETDLTVYPRVDIIEPLPYTVGQDPLAGVEHATALGATGDEFYALRAYEMGDDLRRVHWPSTARLDDLMIRQDEMPWQGRATIVLDLRRSVHTPESLELCVSAAASIALACWRRKSLLRIVTTGGVDSGFGSGHAHTDSILERLALADVHGGGDFAATLKMLQRTGPSGAIAVVTTGKAAGTEVNAAARLGARSDALWLVIFERSSWDSWVDRDQRRAGDATGTAGTRSGTVVRVTKEKPFATAWRESMLRRSARGGSGARGGRGAPAK